MQPRLLFLLSNVYISIFPRPRTAAISMQIWIMTIDVKLGAWFSPFLCAVSYTVNPTKTSATATLKKSILYIYLCLHLATPRGAIWTLKRTLLWLVKWLKSTPFILSRRLLYPTFPYTTDLRSRLSAPKSWMSFEVKKHSYQKSMLVFIFIVFFALFWWVLFPTDCLFSIHPFCLQTVTPLSTLDYCSPFHTHIFFSSKKISILLSITPHSTFFFQYSIVADGRWLWKENAICGESFFVENVYIDAKRRWAYVDLRIVYV